MGNVGTLKHIILNEKLKYKKVKLSGKDVLKSRCKLHHDERDDNRHKYDVKDILKKGKSNILDQEYTATADDIQRKIDYFFMPYNYQLDYSKGLIMTDDDHL